MDVLLKDSTAHQCDVHKYIRTSKRIDAQCDSTSRTYERMVNCTRRRRSISLMLEPRGQREQMHLTYTSPFNRYPLPFSETTFCCVRVPGKVDCTFCFQDSSDWQLERARFCARDTVSLLGFTIFTTTRDFSHASHRVRKTSLVVPAYRSKCSAER